MITNAKQVYESLLQKIQKTAASYDQRSNFNRAVVRDCTHRLNLIQNLQTSHDFEEAFDGVQPEQLIEMAEEELELLVFLNEESDVNPWTISPEDMVARQRRLHAPFTFNEGTADHIDHAVSTQFLEQNFGTSDPDLLFEVDVPGLPESTKNFQDNLRSQALARQQAAQEAKEAAAEAASKV